MKSHDKARYKVREIKRYIKCVKVGFQKDPQASFYKATEELRLQTGACGVERLQDKPRV